MTYLGISIIFFALSSPVHTISGSILSIGYIYLCTYLYASYHTLLIADEMNELCTREKYSQKKVMMMKLMMVDI